MFPDPLRAFQHVVRAGSIRKASEQLSVAPSSISRQIAILERLIGTPLFLRSVGGITLTHAGQLVAEYTDSVIGGFDALRMELNDLRGVSRQITVAMVESITSYGPTRAMRTFRQSFPNVTFDFTILPAPSVVEAVLTQRCDIGIGYNMQADPMIVCVAHIAEPVVAVVPVDHPLADNTAIRLHDLVNEDLAIPHQSFGFRRMLDRLCADHQLAIRPVLETNCFEALRDFARSGAGVAILPQRAAWPDREARRISTIPIDHPPFRDSTLDITLRRQSRVPRLTRLFAESLATHLTLA